MNTRLEEVIWINDTAVCSLEHLAEASGLSVAEVEDLIECGVIVPLDESIQPEIFLLRQVVNLRAARRLRDDFELDRYGVALALTLLLRIEALQAELQTSQVQQADAVLLESRLAPVTANSS